MRALFITVSIVLFSLSLRAQQRVAVLTDDDKIYTSPVEVMPEYKGGENGLYFRLNHIRYLFAERMRNIQGKVLVVFVVEKDGTISNTKLVNSLSPDQDKEILRVINNLRKWKPGMQDGKPVRVQLSIPIDFKLINNS